MEVSLGLFVVISINRPNSLVQTGRSILIKIGMWPIHLLLQLFFFFLSKNLEIT